jgi:hypothetical protein
MCHLIDSHPLIIQNQGTVLFTVFFCSGCGWASCSFFISDTCVTILVIHLNTLRCGKALFPYCAGSLEWISVPGTLSAHKNLFTACHSSLMHTESGAAMLIMLRRHYNWLIKDEGFSQ